MKTLSFPFFLLSALLVMGSACDDDDSRLVPRPPFTIGFPTVAVTDTCVIDPTPWNFHDYYFLPLGFLNMETSSTFPDELLFYVNYRDTVLLNGRPETEVFRADVRQGSLTFLQAAKPYSRAMEWSGNLVLTAGWDAGKLIHDLTTGESYYPFVDYGFSAGYWLTDSIFVGQDNSKGIFLCNVTGEILHKIEMPTSRLTAENGELWGVSTVRDSIYQYRLDRDTTIAYAPYPTEIGWFGMDYDGDNTLWITTNRGLYRFRIAEKELEPYRLFECRNAYYRKIKVNFADPNLLYVWRVDYRPDAAGTIWGRETINVLDLTTLEERELLFFE